MTINLLKGDKQFKYIHEHYPEKIITVFFPPLRRNNVFKGIAKGTLDIGRKKLKDHQFNDHMTNKIGDSLKRPVEWL